MVATHLWYDTKGQERIIGFYCELIANQGGDPPNTYYVACGFGRGYLGMQVNSDTERRILFSVWNDIKGAQVEALEKGDGVIVQPFGGEGEGIQSIFVHMWETGVPQKFRIDAQLDDTATIYTGYYWIDNDWKVLASLRAPNDGSYLKGLYSFLENFGADTSAERRCVYRDQSIRVEGSEELIPLTDASCTATAEDSPFEFGAEDGGFYMRINGNAVNYPEDGKRLWLFVGGNCGFPGIHIPSRTGAGVRMTMKGNMGGEYTQWHGGGEGRVHGGSENCPRRTLIAVVDSP